MENCYKDFANVYDAAVDRTLRVPARAPVGPVRSSRPITRLRAIGTTLETRFHPNFGNPINSLPSPLFGLSGLSTQKLANGLGSGGANGGFNPLYQIGAPRSVQVVIKLMSERRRIS
jgi:hypothetical protein